MASESTTWGANIKGVEACCSLLATVLLRLRGSMGKYSFKGRGKTVERFTMRQGGLGILVAIGGTLGGLLLLWMLGYLHFDVQ